MSVSSVVIHVGADAEAAEMTLMQQGRVSVTISLVQSVGAVGRVVVGWVVVGWDVVGSKLPHAAAFETG